VRVGQQAHARTPPSKPSGTVKRLTAAKPQREACSRGASTIDITCAHFVLVGCTTVPP
jgi:hypothetical protein